MTKSIKFYWNGIRINGDKALIKCHYSMNSHGESEYVTIYADSYSHCLPSDLFPVKNDTDYYTDYFDNDHAVLLPSHPLYKFARYAAEKAKIRDLKSYIKHQTAYMEKDPYFAAKYHVADEVNERMKLLAELEAHEDPGHPGDEDIAAVHEMNLAAENARKAAALEAEQKAREEHQRKINDGRRYIEEVAAEHPIKEGEPVVTIRWSEHPAFYSWEDDELKLSLAAAEIILKHFDEEVHAEEDRGYDKTKFLIEYVNEDGEQDTYEGRYDLGDNDGGLIEHIRSFGSYYAEKGKTEEEREEGEAIVAFAEKMAGYTVEEAMKKFYMVEIVYWPALDMAKGNTFIAIAKQKPTAENVKDGDAVIHRVYFEDPVEAEDYRQRMMADYKGGSES